MHVDIIETEWWAQAVFEYVYGVINEDQGALEAHRHHQRPWLLNFKLLSTHFQIYARGSRSIHTSHVKCCWWIQWGEDGSKQYCKDGENYAQK